MKKHVLILTMLALLTPVLAQEPVPDFADHEEFWAYFEPLMIRRAELQMQQESAVTSRKQRADEYRKAAEAETDPEQKQFLLDRAAMESRMVGEVWSSIQNDLFQLDKKIQAVEEKYKFVYVEVFPYYREREQYSKEELQDALKKASPSIRRSRTGRALKRYIRTLK